MINSVIRICFVNRFSGCFFLQACSSDSWGYREFMGLPVVSKACLELWETWNHGKQIWNTHKIAVSTQTSNWFTTWFLNSCAKRLSSFWIRTVVHLVSFDGIPQLESFENQFQCQISRKPLRNNGFPVKNPPWFQAKSQMFMDFPIVFHSNLLNSSLPQPSPPFPHFASLGAKHKAVVLRFRRSEWMAEGRERLGRGRGEKQKWYPKWSDYVTFSITF